MATLKGLVDETTNIKNEIVECRDTLKQILIDKKIEGLENENKLSTLINKVNKLREFKEPLWLYKAGVENVSFTFSGRSGSPTCSYQKGSNYLKLYGNNDTWGQFVTTNSIDLTAYSKVFFDLELVIPTQHEYNYGRFCVYDAKGTHSTVKTISNTRPLSRDLYVLDISNVTGNKFVGFDINAYNSNMVLNVYNIYLE